MNRERKIFGIGETTVDLIINNTHPLEFRPGGAVLNACVSLGRLGLNVSIVSSTGNDQLGEISRSFLLQNKVDVTYLSKFNGNTRLALAFLDENRNAAYYFYEDPGHSFLVDIPVFRNGDILLHGSSFSLKEQNQILIRELIQFSSVNNVIVYYDPNFRATYLSKMNKILPFFLNNFRNAHIVKGSEEDFKGILGADTVENTFDKISSLGEKVLIYTMGGRGVWLMTKDMKIFTAVEEVKPLSTIGAGDTFNAGVLYGLVEHNIDKNRLFSQNEDVWRSILKTAAGFAAEVCLSMENYLGER